MQVTKQTVANHLGAYLRHELTLGQLVDWAENAVMEGEFDAASTDVLREVVARLGVADVRTFGLTWEDCEEMLRLMGYGARVEVVPA